MKKSPHLSVQKGKRVRVKLTDGTVVCAKFVEKKSRYIVLESNGDVSHYQHEDIKSLCIAKGIL